MPPTPQKHHTFQTKLQTELDGYTMESTNPDSSNEITWSPTLQTRYLLSNTEMTELKKQVTNVTRSIKRLNTILDVIEEDTAIKLTPDELFNLLKELKLH